MRKKRPAEERFWEKVEKTDTHWIWIGARKIDGHPYGKMRVGKKFMPAHRYSYELHFGPIPKGMNICHHCDIPYCVKPDHLWLGTQKRNMVDCAMKEHQGYLTINQVKEIRSLSDNYTSKQLAKIYKTSENNIYAIINRVSWKFV